MPNRSFSIKEIFADSENVVEWPSNPEPGWTPTEGIPYRDPNVPADKIADGWPYNQIVKSEQFNEVMRDLSGVVKDIECHGVARWSEYTNYEIGAICLYNGVSYRAVAASGPDISGGAAVPATNIDKWVVAPISWRAYDFRAVSSNTNILPNELVYCKTGNLSVNLPSIPNANCETRVKIVCGAGIYNDASISINAASGQVIADSITTTLYLDAPFSFVELYYEYASSIWRITSYGMGTSQTYRPKPFASKAIFEIFWSVSNETPAGAMSLCYDVAISGDTITNDAGVIKNCNVKYPDFWRELLKRRDASKIRVLSIANWTTEYKNNGSCAAFVINETTKSVRLPCILNYLRSSKASEQFKQESPQLPNLKGTFGHFPAKAIAAAYTNSNLFKVTLYDTPGGTAGDEGWVHHHFDITMDASKYNSIYAENGIVRPSTSTACLYIQVANADAGRSDSGTSGSTQYGWYKIDGNGFIEQGGTIANVTTSGVNVNLPYDMPNTAYQIQLTANADGRVYVSAKLQTYFTVKSGSGTLGAVDWYLRGKLE